MNLFTAAGKNDVLLAELDQFSGMADTVGAGRAGRTERVIDAFDAERGRQAGGSRRSHRFGDGVRADAPDAAVAQDIGDFNLR